MIPLCDLQQQYLDLQHEIDAAMQAVAMNGRYILGPNVKAFEAEMAAYCDCTHAIGVGSGTDALQLALRALDIGPGDEVITTPFTFVATTEAIGMVGAKPVFIDIDPVTFNIDPKRIEPAITEHTKAILPVHLYGQPCDMDAIMRIARQHNLSVVEDCAQAIGATWKGQPVGTFGDAGCFSFFPSKNLGAMGDGGMVTTNDLQVFERVEMLRRHGGRVKYHHEELGLNSRLDELQAAILRIKLEQLPRWIDLRRKHAYRYNAILNDCSQLTCPAELASSGTIRPLTETGLHDSELCRCVYHQYTVQLDGRDELAKLLKKHEIGHAIYYPIPLHLQEVHADLGILPGTLPFAESAAEHCLSLPMFPELTEHQQDVVTTCLKTFATDHNVSSQSQSAA